MTAITKNFLGLTIEGDISSGAKRVPQRPLEEFAPIIQAVLDDPTIVEFGWHQYTPYFNDGDPCVFSVGTFWVRSVDDAPFNEDEDDEGTYTESLDVDYGHPTLGQRLFSWDPETHERDAGTYEGPDEARFDRCKALSEAVQGGAFNDVLLEAFGDHTRVKVSRSGIQVEEYEHE